MKPPPTTPQQYIDSLLAEIRHLRLDLEITRQARCARIVKEEKYDILRSALEEILQVQDLANAHEFAREALSQTNPDHE